VGVEFIEPAFIAVADGRIVYIGREFARARDLVPGAEVHDLSTCIAAPGFIDLHVHGALGWDFYDCPGEKINEVTEFFACHGTTTLLATVTTGDLEQMGAAVATLAQYMRWGGRGAEIAGIFLEGPFCSEARRGTFRPEYLLKPSWQVLKPWVEEYHEEICLVGLAPELPGAEDVVDALHAQGIKTCICHSDGDAQDLDRAVARGVTHLTHFYNGMRPMAHRDPGIVGAALARGGVTVELICDFQHVHPLAIEVAMRCLGSENIALITDAMRACGCPPGEYIISEQVAVVQDGRALIDGRTLAGSILTMDQAVRNMLSLGYPEVQVLNMASRVPARIAGLDDRGQLAPGRAADIVFLDEDYQVVATVKGSQLYIKEMSS